MDSFKLKIHQNPLRSLGELKTLPHPLVGDRAYPVAAARVWNTLPQHVTSAPSLHDFAFRLKTHFFSVSFPEQFSMYSACEVTSSLLDTLIDHLTYLLTSRLGRGTPTPHSPSPCSSRVKASKRLEQLRRFALPSNGASQNVVVASLLFVDGFRHCLHGLHVNINI